MHGGRADLRFGRSRIVLQARINLPARHNSLLMIIPPLSGAVTEMTMWGAVMTPRPDRPQITIPLSPSQVHPSPKTPPNVTSGGSVSITVTSVAV